MIKKLLLALSMVTAVGAVRSQAQLPCGTDHMHRERLAEHPEIADNEVELRRQITENLAKMDISKYAKTTEDGDIEYHVPVVFHVIHNFQNTAAEDIWRHTSDDQIVEAVAQLNRLYNKKNADTADVIAPYKGFIPNSRVRYIGNARIIWHLATKDPYGNPTNGVTRRHHYLSDYGSDYSKFDLWPQSSYMNIWVVNRFKPKSDGNSPAAYAYKPADAAAIPYWDGVITTPLYVNYANALGHELGHCLDLDHTFGGTNGDTSSTTPRPWFVASCGDDGIEDTPPTKGHKPSEGCSFLALYDKECLFDTLMAAKPRWDTVRRRRLTAPIDTTTIVTFSDTSTMKGITFQSRTAATLRTVTIYPSAPVGSTYTVGLYRTKDNVLINSRSYVSRVVNARDSIDLNFSIAALPKDEFYQLRFITNPGAYRDTAVPSISGYSRGVPGSILITEPTSDGMYNFFYNWRMVKGYFQLYAGDSLVDYPDTVNSQNVMDYTYCSKMFTNGQTVHMRAALTSSVAKRDSLISLYNHRRTGIDDAAPAPVLTPKALYAVRRLTSLSSDNEPAYFLCADNAQNFVFQNFTWRSPATSINWSLSNDASTPTSTSTTTVTSKFSTPGWAKVTMIATNANGSDTFTTNPGIYVASNETVNPIGYYQDFNPSKDTDLDKWPIFNYFNNRYKWELFNGAGYYDATSIRYRSFDDRTTSPANSTGDPTGDYDDFFTPAFDLSVLGADGNLNFMLAGAYNTSNSLLMNDALEISYSINCGQNWLPLKTISKGQLQTRGLTSAVGVEYVPNVDDWVAQNIDLKTTAGAPIRNSKVFFRFRFKPWGRQIYGGTLATGNNVYIDRINISQWPLGVNDMVLAKKDIAVSPNPTNANAYVLFRNPNGRVNIQVMDVTGKVVYSVDSRVDQGSNRVEIPASALTVKGMYLVRISGDGNLNHTEKLVVY